MVPSATPARGRDVAHLHGVVAAVGAELEGGHEHALAARGLALGERVGPVAIAEPTAALGQLAERHVPVGPGLGREAEDPLADDVALDLVGAPGDAQRRRVQELGRPHAAAPAGAAPASMPVAPCTCIAAVGHLLHEAGVGELHHRGLRARARALGQRGLRPEPQVAQQLAAEVRVDHRLAHERIAGHAELRASAIEPGRVRAPGAAGDGGALAGQGGLGHPPPLADLAEHVARPGCARSSRNTSLKWASPVIWRSGRISMPGVAMSTRK